MNDVAPEAVERQVLTYESAGGTETFISYEDPEEDLLVGFCRLRFPNDPARRELRDAALVRELHVYGPMVEVGDSGEDWQHRGYGGRLLRAAEERAADAGYDELSVISGIGAREYYKDRGYRQDGPYVSKRL